MATSQCWGAARERSRFLTAWQHSQPAAAPGSISEVLWPGLPLLHGHLPSPGSPDIVPQQMPLAPACPPPALSRGRGSYPVGGGWRGLDTEQQAGSQADVAVAVAAELLAPPHQLADLQARQPGHGRRGGDDGGHDPPGNPLALGTGGASPAAPHRTGTPEPTGCPSHRQPGGGGDAVVLCTQVGRCCDKVDVDIVVLWGRVGGTSASHGGSSNPQAEQGHLPGSDTFSKWMGSIKGVCASSSPSSCCLHCARSWVSSVSCL